MLTVGIVGLPNVGKSTLFNALTSGEAKVSNYPFTTIDSNVGVVEVPDPRLRRLEEILRPRETTPATIEFFDIAGLVEGASRGEGLGNQFLGNIRGVDAIVHVLRCFEHGEVAHAYGELDPLHDAGVVETELLLADLEVLTRAVEKQKKLWMTDPRSYRAERELMESCLAALADGRSLRSLELPPEARARLKALGMLSAKPVIWVANLAEDEPGPEEPAVVEKLRRGLSADEPAEVLGLSAQLELELSELDDEERAEFMSVLGLERRGLELLVERCFDRLHLIRFYTVVSDKLRAWQVPRGTAAPQAAGRIHTDMEQGFIRAEVVAFEELRQAGDLHELRSSGRVRREGKSYEIRDGDVVEFLFGR